MSQDLIAQIRAYSSQLAEEMTPVDHREGIPVLVNPAARPTFAVGHRRRFSLGLAVMVVLIALAISLLRSPSPTTVPIVDQPLPPTATTVQSPTSINPLRQDGEVITWSGDDPRRSGDLVAQDPETSEVRTLVPAASLSYRPQSGDMSVGMSLRIGSAAWSADGRWVAWEILECGGGWSDEAGAGGLWVTNGVDEPRQLTKPCFEEGNVSPHAELWEWSPTGAQLAVARKSIDGDALILIDPATGDRTHLGKTAGDVTSLAWSPDGTQIAYGAVPTGTSDDPYSAAEQGSVHSVGVNDGVHSLLASSLGLVSGGETGSGIRWSPDGARIAVLTEAVPETRLYLMEADGSNLHLLTEGIVIAHGSGSPGLTWSPDGTTMAYATSSGQRERLQVWSHSPDGSAPILVFTSGPAPPDFGCCPVWSPDGKAIAFSSVDGWLIANADGTGDAQEIDELRYLSWRGGWYFCECFG